MEAWQYKREDAKPGPANDTELRALLPQEEIIPETSMQKESSEEWAPAPEVPAPVSSNQHAAAVPPPLPASTPSVPAIPATTSPTGWLWISSLLFAMDILVLGFMQFVFSLYALFLLAGVTGLPSWFVQCVNALDSRIIWPRIGMFVLLILWQGCAFGSLIRLYGDRRLEHGRGSGFWWITPIANLFMPFHCLRELRWASRTQRTKLETEGGAGVVIWLIQATIVYNIIVTVADRLVTGGDAEAAASTLATALNLASNLGGLAQAFFLTIFVLRHLIDQVRLCRAWTVPQGIH